MSDTPTNPATGVEGPSINPLPDDDLTPWGGGDDNGHDVTPAPMSPADMVRSVEVALDGKRGDLKRLTAEQQRVAGQIKVVKDEIAEHERFLRAWKPRKSPAKKVTTTKPTKA